MIYLYSNTKFKNMSRKPENQQEKHQMSSPESFLHLILWPIFRQSHPNFRGGRNVNASEIWAQLTKNLLTKSGTERF